MVGIPERILESEVALEKNTGRSSKRDLGEAFRGTLNEVLVGFLEGFQKELLNNSQKILRELPGRFSYEIPGINPYGFIEGISVRISDTISCTNSNVSG